MASRRALLVGVPEYDSDAITNLSIVRNDVNTLHAALESSQFSVCSVGLKDKSETTRSKILQKIRSYCRQARDEETLLLYFSGHGLHHNGKDYLIPSDATLDDAEAIEEYLVTIDFGNVFDQSQAKTILFFTDACREGVELYEKTLGNRETTFGEESRMRGCVRVFSRRG